MNGIATFSVRPEARGFRSAFFNVGPAMDLSAIYAPDAGRPRTVAARLERSARRVAASWGRVGRRIARRLESEGADVAGK